MVAGTNGNDHDPTVAMNAAGQYVIAWDHDYYGNGTDIDVRAQAFNANFAPVTGTVLVAQTSHDENNPSAGIDYYGNFAVAYTYAYSPTDHDIYVQRFNASGTNVGSVYVATSTHEEYEPSLDMNASGSFVVAYTYDYSATDQDVYAKSFNPSGGLLNSVAIAISGTPEDQPAVAIDGQGNYVVAYTLESSPYTSAYFRRVSSTGQYLGAPVREDSPTGGSGGFSGGGSTMRPAVEMSAAGQFVVTYVTESPTSGNPTGLAFQEFNSGGSWLGGDSFTDSRCYQASVGVDTLGNFTIGDDSDIVINYRG
jgi:hypothetical protein